MIEKTNIFIEDKFSSGKNPVMNLILLISLFGSLFWSVYVFVFANNFQFYVLLTFGLASLLSLLFAYKKLNQNNLLKVIFLISILGPFLINFIFDGIIHTGGVITVTCIPAIALINSINKQQQTIVTISYSILIGFTISTEFILFNNPIKIPESFSYLFLFNLLFVFLSSFGLLKIKSYNKKLYGLYIESEVNKAKEAEKTAIERDAELKQSVDYARMIQYNLLLESIDTLNEQVNYFLFYKPKDKVGGDFFWCHKLDEKKFILLVGDCTGHGIPGGFMAMISITLLNQMSLKDKTFSTASVLTQLNDGLLKNFGHNLYENTMRDSVDCAVCIIDKNENTIEVSAAYHSVYILKKEEDFNQIHEIKGDKIYLGSVSGDLNISTHKKTLNDGDMIYLFSDGIVDQFGGPKFKKFTKKRFKDYLLENAMLTPDKQKTKLSNVLYKWKGEKEQTDDIIVAGIIM